MYERYQKVKFTESGMEAAAKKIEDEVWRDLTDETTRHTIDMLVKHVQVLEDRVDELEELINVKK